MKFLNCRVDAFYLAFQGRIRPAVRELLMERLASATALRTFVAVQIGPYRGAMTPRSREGWWLLQNADMHVRLEEGASGEWSLEVRPLAVALAMWGPRAALESARVVARELLEAVQGERLRRLDICGDVTGFKLRTVKLEALVCHWRTRAQAISVVKQYFRAGKRTGFAIGSGDVVARIYDKTEELRLERNDGAKRHEEHTTWRMAGWNGEEDVTRVEFQLRGEVLKEFHILDPETALRRLDAMWSYCTRKWLKLVLPGTASRRDRCAIDPRWVGVQAIVFREAVKEPPKRERCPGRSRARTAASAAINFGAQAGALRPNGVQDPSKHVAEWSEAYASDYVQLTLNFAMQRVARAAAVELVAMFGARGAAAHVMEKVNAACVRFAPLASLGVLASMPLAA